MKILYVTTILNTVNAFLIPHIKMLIEQGHKVDVASNVDQADSTKLIELGCEIYDVPFQRSPIKKDNINAYKLIKKILLTKKYDVVHTHTPIASAITRLACKGIDKTKVFYTAHGFHFYKGAPLKNWLIYYPIEKFLSNYTDLLITMNNEDYNRAKKFNAKKSIHVPGVGLDIKKFKDVEVDRIKKRRELGIPENSFVLLSVGELNRNKNHEIIIKAVAKINKPNIFYIICGQGPLEDYLKKLSRNLNIEDHVKLLGFREDVNEIYKAADVFAFPSFREGLPVSLMEAMAAGLPIICSNIRGNTDLVVQGKGGVIVYKNDIGSYVQAITDIEDSELGSMGKFNQLIINKYDSKNILNIMSNLYLDI